MQAYRDENDVPTLIASSNADGKTPVRLYADPITHRLLIDASGANTFVYNEVVSGSATTFTLANTPVSGLYAIFAEGQRLTPGAGNDFTISGAVITTALSWPTGSILADYQH